MNKYNKICAYSLLRCMHTVREVTTGSMVQGTTAGEHVEGTTKSEIRKEKMVIDAKYYTQYGTLNNCL